MINSFLTKLTNSCYPTIERRPGILLIDPSIQFPFHSHSVFSDLLLGLKIPSSNLGATEKMGTIWCTNPPLFPTSGKRSFQDLHPHSPSSSFLIPEKDGSFSTVSPSTYMLNLISQLPQPWMQSYLLKDSALSHFYISLQASSTPSLKMS